MNQVRFGIIGCGRILKNHLDGILSAPSACLAAVCDIVEERAREAAELGGLSKWYADIDTMLDNEKLDVCCILTPSGMHAEHAITVARRGVSVLCEKPIDVKPEKMEAMIQACRENGVKLGGIFQRRTFEAATVAKRMIESGTLGRVTLGSAYLKYYRDQEYYDSGDWRGTWELDGGGALMNQGIHGVDLIDYIMGGIQSVRAVCDKLVWDIDVEDTAVAIVRFKNGALGVIEGATSAYPGLETTFEICGSKGSIAFGDKDFYRWELMDKSIKKPEVSGSMGGVNCAYCEGNYGHTIQIEDMARAVIEDREPMVTGDSAARSVKIVLAIYESSKKGGAEVMID